MRHVLTIFLCMLFASCGGGSIIQYKPDVSGVQNPIRTIKATLEEQPSSYAYVPYEVEVNDQFMSFALGAGHRQPGTFTRLYYKRIGKITLSKSWKYPTYEVNIWENTGAHAAIVVTLEENKAKDFINAVQYMVEQVASRKSDETLQSAPATKKGEIEEKLETLRDLFNKGLITEEEYTQKKALLLESL